MDGFVDSLTVHVMFVISGPFGGALDDWHGMFLASEAYGADRKCDGGVGMRYPREIVCLCVVPKGMQSFWVGRV